MPKPKISKNTTLIITEKPQAAAKIAAALSNAKDQKYTTKEKVSYYEFQRDGRTYIVGCAVGHLFGIQQIAQRGPFPNFDIKWQPAHQKKNSAFTKKYLTTLKKISKDVDEFIIATDFDREGEVIGWNVLRYICKQKDAKRMKFSTLTKDELERSFQEVHSHIEWGAAYAGETRHYLDWFYGINLSRGLMKALSKTGQFRILSIGRVQGPSLNLLVEREKEINKFIPTPYWQIFTQIRDIKKQKAELKYTKDITNKSELLKFQHLKGKKAIAETNSREDSILAPIPFDLTTLQTECYKHLRLTPSQTLSVAQGLYTNGIISYPRTSSQEYPKGIEYDKILKRIKKYTTLVKYITNKTPTKGKKKDPAHPAIYPTGETKKLKDLEKKVYDLIVKRFISCFCKPAIVERRQVAVMINNLKFTMNGSSIKEKNWMNVYPTDIKEESIPTINGDVDVLEIRTEEKMTKPPRRYTPASLIKELEKRELGTKATRSSIIETLFNRGYVAGKSIEVSDLGMQMHKTLEEFAPLILDEKMTSQMEKQMEKIELSTKNYQEQEGKLLEKAKKDIISIAKSFTKNLDKIGESLADANQKVWDQEREANTMNECPVCKEGKLTVRYGRKFSRYFVACNNYPKCKTTFSLPPNGVMKPARDKDKELELCKECGYPLVASFKKGKAPWRFCFNPTCPTNKELQEKKEEFKKKLASGEVIIKDGKIIDTTKTVPKKKPRKKQT